MAKEPGPVGVLSRVGCIAFLTPFVILLIVLIFF